MMAQPTMQYPDNVPSIGDIYEIQFVETGGLSTEPSGPDVSWDYSELTSLFGGQLTAIDPSQTPSGAQFPTADVAISMGDTIFTYARTNTDGYFYLGSESTSGTFPSLLVYSDSRTFLKFPFTYDDTYFDAYKGVATTSVASVHVTAATEMFADAYGTLILPYGTVNNVLRIVTVDAELDSVFVGGNYVKTFEIVRSQYSWFAADSKGPLMSIEIVNNTYYGVTDTVAYYTTSGSGIGDNSSSDISELSVFPNPAGEYVIIELETNPNTVVTISLVNQVGQFMVSKTASDNNTGSLSERLDVTAIPAGLYFINVSCDCGKQITQKLVIR